MPHTILPFYNVDSRVGGGQGRTMDVMLVQYMLFKVCINGLPHFNKQVGFTPVAPDVSGPGAIFPFTGLYSRELDSWIRAFQMAANQRGYGPLTVDGMINPAPIGSGKRSIGKTGRWYTLQALNTLMAAKSEMPYSQLPLASDLPGVLANDLAVFGLEDYLSTRI
jgi:hypothetical protein